MHTKNLNETKGTGETQQLQQNTHPPRTRWQRI